MRGALFVAVALLVAVAIASLAGVRLRSWNGFDLAALAQDEVRRRLPVSDSPIFLDRPDGRTDVHPTGRGDLRVVCGWVTIRSDRQPRFFYVLYGLGMFSLSTDEVFIQSRPDQASPKGGESWCRSPALT